MRIFAGFLKERAREILLYIITLALLKFVFFLYNLPSDALNYGFLLVLVLAGILFFIDFCEFYKRHKELVLVEKNMQDALLDLPEPDTLIENDYQDLLDKLEEIRRKLKSEELIFRQEMQDYYGMWVQDIAMSPSVAEDLRHYGLVAARESITYEVAKEVGAKALLMPDPAFHMMPEPCEVDERFPRNEVIGINISPVVIHSEKNTGAAYANYKTLIQYILDNTDASIALIPHVVWAHNDDRVPLKQLYDDFDQDSRLILVEDHTAPELKYIISKCSFFVGARTHATIAAYSTGVPTLVVGYSVKARGIARDLFGTEDGYVLPVQQLKESDELTQAFIRLYEKRDAIRGHLNELLPGYIARADEARNALEELAKA